MVVVHAEAQLLWPHDARFEVAVLQLVSCAFEAHDVRSVDVGAAAPFGQTHDR